MDKRLFPVTPQFFQEEIEPIIERYMVENTNDVTTN